ncbi:alpha/beta hydrolase [Mediterraneibacter agrestimuris]|uniref:alpha/beta hydrolase n=1 Tax=Mediterraneibacter agrestimuris TaxID=2941333 RepID=UPI002040E3ED|nr:alpha/beta hydrolase [Mediterraneibacter agrestimuris]
MISERYLLWETSEYNYPMAFGFVPDIVSYLHEDTEKRPCILVVPGGGYRVVSPTEGEIVALEFYNKGYNAFVCTYTVNLCGLEPLREQPMCDLSRAIRYIRANSELFHVNEDQLTVCGFSAGGHLCGSVCVHYEDIKDENPKYAEISNRPDAAILSYPVITAGEKAHRGSFEALFGEGATEKELQYMSLENHVTQDTPPCFLWQTATDETVPVENSYLFAEACKANKVPYAHHVFSKGRHGLSLANEDWASGKFGGQYTLEQIECLVKAAEEGNVSIPKEAIDRIKKEFGIGRKIIDKTREVPRIGEPSKEAAVWPMLADTWLKSMR